MNYSERPVSNTKLNSQPVNISECADVTVQALKILGLDIAKDADYLTELYNEKYSLLLDGQPRSGEPFAQLQLDNDFRLRTMLDKIDNQTYNNKKYQRFSVWYKAPWTKNPTNENFFHKNIRRRDANNASLRHLTGQARLALNDGKNPMEPVIFLQIYLSMPKM